MEVLLFDILYLLFQSCKGTGSAAFLNDIQVILLNIKSDRHEVNEFLETQYGQSFDLAIFGLFTPELQ